MRLGSGKWKSSNVHKQCETKPTNGLMEFAETEFGKPFSMAWCGNPAWACDSGTCQILCKEELLVLFVNQQGHYRNPE